MATVGIDVSKCKAQSGTCATTTKKANKLGLSAQQIIDTANYDKGKIIYRFCGSDVRNDQFQNKIIIIRLTLNLHITSLVTQM